jgi:hypothetical protein
VTGTGATISGGNGNAAASGSLLSAPSAVRGGYANSALGKYYVIYGGLHNLENQTAISNDVTLEGDSNSVTAVNSTLINGAHNTLNSINSLAFASNANVSGSAVIAFEPAGSSGTSYWGIGTTSPTQAVDVVGNVKFSGSLNHSSDTTSGQWLYSNGSGLPPTWGTASSIASTNWGLLGNSGSNPSTNFIGTTDAQDFAIRTNNAERARITSAGFVGIGTAAPTSQLQSVYSGTSDEAAAIFGNASGSTASQSVGVWGSENTTSSNAGTLGVFCTGGGNTTAGSTNAALQISQGEFAMGRTTDIASFGTNVEPAASGTAYSQQGASGVVQLSLDTNLHALPPSSGVYQDLGTDTINNQFITSSSIVIAGVVAKINGSDTNAKNSIYRVDVGSRSAGSCIIRIGMMPFETSALSYSPNDYIRVAYAVINPGR